MSDRSSPTTVCPRCAVGCHLERGDGSRARGDAGPANPEGRLCRKGATAFEVVEDGDRLTRPLVRRDGDLVPVSWERAYEAVVESIEEVLDARGPDALAFLGAPRCTNEENYLLGKLARTLGTNDVDNRARLCHAETARTLSERLGWPATTNGLDDLRAADVILVAGANPAERQPVAFNSFVRPAVDDGATLVHVDPVGNRTTRLADVHLAPRPGGDAAVFDLLSAHVLGADGVDRAFVAERTRGAGEFTAELAALDRAAVASAAGVDDDTAERIAGEVAGADRVAALTGTGIEGTSDGEDGSGGGAGDGPDVERTAPDALLDLLLLTGNLGRPGTGVYVLRGLVNEQGATDAGCVPDRLPGHQPVTDPGARTRVAAEWGVEPPAEPGRTARELLASFGDGIAAAVVVGENPAVSKRDPEWIRRRLDALDTLVVLDVLPTGTTRSADVVLPAAAGVEKAGTVTNLDRRVQRLHPTTAPPGEARPDFEIVREIGRRLFPGTDHFEYGTVGDAFDELARVAPTHAGVSYAELGGEGRRWPFEEDAVLYRDRFDTADGLARFGSKVVDPGSDSGSAVDSESGGRFRLVTGGRASDGSDERDRGDRPLRIHPVDADELGLATDDRVAVSNDEVVVEATVRTDEGVRRGTVFLHAAVADPLVRRGASTVTVERSPGSVDDAG